MRTFASSSVTVLLALFAVCSLAGCAGIGVVETSDPTQQLRDAEILFSQKDRPLIAERLIREALATSEEQHDYFGIANAYRTYGFFLRSDSVTWSEYYRKKGFLEPSVTWDTRLDGSARFFQKAAELYDRMSRYDASTNVYLNMGHTFSLMHETLRACAAYSMSLERYHENLRAHPNAKPDTAPGYASFEEFIRAVEAQDGCQKDADPHA